MRRPLGVEDQLFGNEASQASESWFEEGIQSVPQLQGSLSLAAKSYMIVEGAGGSVSWDQVL